MYPVKDLVVLCTCGPWKGVARLRLPTCSVSTPPPPSAKNSGRATGLSQWPGVFSSIWHQVYSLVAIETKTGTVIKRHECAFVFLQARIPSWDIGNMMKTSQVLNNAQSCWIVLTCAKWLLLSKVASGLRIPYFVKVKAWKSRTLCSLDENKLVSCLWFRLATQPVSLVQHYSFAMRQHDSNLVRRLGSASDNKQGARGRSRQ